MDCYTYSCFLKIVDIHGQLFIGCLRAIFLELNAELEAKCGRLAYSSDLFLNLFILPFFGESLETLLL